MLSSRLRAKLALDPYYETLAQATCSRRELLAAGFFDDGLDASVRELACWNPRMLTTPTLKVRRNLAASTAPSRKLVLLSTGSFSPVHSGHLHMMEAARQCAEQQGFEVVGGYLSASHDSYVSQKAGGAAAMHAESRIALLEEAVSSSDWLMVCPWEARHAPLALNFTDVLDRLQLYLDEHLGGDEPVTVAYVFGSDNLRFFDAFRERGMAFCILRSTATPCGEDLTWLQSHPGRQLGRLHLVPQACDVDSSSTRVRAGDHFLVPDHARARYASMTDAAGRPSQPHAPLYLLRDDLMHGTSHWALAQDAAASFARTLQELLSGAVPEGVRVLNMPQTEQLHAWSIAERASHGPRARVLSLDVCLAGDAQLGISRRFDIGGGQVRASAMGARPGSPSLAHQLTALASQAPGRLEGLTAEQPWVVVDDDQATGATEQEVRRRLAQVGITSPQFAYLNHHFLASRGLSAADVLDVVDARDFMLGARDAGLVVELPDGTVARAPYMLPFVNLAFRAKIPPALCQELSKALWLLNKSWFEAHGPALAVNDADPACAALLRYLGFDDGVKLSVCCHELSAWSGPSFWPSRGRNADPALAYAA